MKLTYDDIKKMSWKKVTALYLEIAEAALRRAKNWRHKPFSRAADRPAMRDFEIGIEVAMGIGRFDCVFCIKHGNTKMKYGAKCKGCPVAIPCQVHNVVVNENDFKAEIVRRREYAAFITMCKEYFAKHIK